MSKFCQAVRLVVAIVVTTPLVLVVAALTLLECVLRMVSGALTRLGISILRTLKGGNLVVVPEGSQPIVGTK